MPCLRQRWARVRSAGSDDKESVIDIGVVSARIGDFPATVWLVSAIELHALRESDTRDLFELWSDAEVVRFTNWSLLQREEEAAERFQRIQKRYAGAEDRVGPFTLRRQEDDFVGLIGIDYVEEEHELWYLLRRSQWGRGYGTAAVTQLLQRITGHPRIRTLVATAVVQNTASWRLLERTGFSRTHTLPLAFQRDGISSDLFKYARPCSLM